MDSHRNPILRIGIDDAPPVPMQIGTPESGDFHGYEVDLLQKLAERLDFTIQYRRVLWSALVGELSSGNLDLVCSAATVTQPPMDCRGPEAASFEIESEVPSSSVACGSRVA